MKKLLWHVHILKSEVRTLFGTYVDGSDSEGESVVPIKDEPTSRWITNFTVSIYMMCLSALQKEDSNKDKIYC